MYSKILERSLLWLATFTSIHLRRNPLLCKYEAAWLTIKVKHGVNLSQHICDRQTINYYLKNGTGLRRWSVPCQQLLTSVNCHPPWWQLIWALLHPLHQQLCLPGACSCMPGTRVGLNKGQALVARSSGVGWPFYSAAGVPGAPSCLWSATFWVIATHLLMRKS